MKKAGFQRSDRVAEQVRRDLADLIRSELKDPRVGRTTGNWKRMNWRLLPRRCRAKEMAISPPPNPQGK